MLSLDHRPFSFDKVVGQRGVVSEFEIRSQTNDFPQVMIFEGPTGTGKTTIAYIVAALINCESPLTIGSAERNQIIQPCGKCDSCRTIQSESFSRDVEIFDASRMGKEDILKLESIAQSEPFYDKKRILIIDEAQELSKAGKGATLKLLENKYPNTHFILCTMDDKALDKSIKARAQVFDFYLVEEHEIAKHLYNILAKEGISDDPEIPDEFFKRGIFLLARNAQGNVREAVQSLEKCIINDYYDIDSLETNLGITSEEKSYDLFQLLLKRDKSFFEKIAKIDLRAFFYYSWKVLTDLGVYSVSGYTNAEWKKEKNQSLVMQYQSQIDWMLNSFKNIYLQQSYWIDSTFLTILIQYYQQKFTNDGVTRVVRRPIDMEPGNRL